MTPHPLPPLTRRTFTATALGGALGLLATGCASDRASGDGGAATGDPTPGGELVFLTSDFPTSLDTVQTYSPYGPQQTVDTLVAQDPDSGEILPWLATGWDSSEDGLTFTLDLRDDVTFSNGERLSAELVKNNIDTLVALGDAGQAALPAAWLAGYQGSEAVDEHTVNITFSEPKAGFLQSLSEKPLAILAQETLDLSAEDRASTGVIGSGPFVLDSYSPGQEIVLTRREGYAWAPSNAGHTGEAYLEKVVVRVSAEAGVRVGSLTSGQAQLADALGQPDVDTVEGTGGSVTFGVGGGTAFTLWPNFDNPILAEEDVRRAISLGIDRQELVDTVWTSYDRPASSIITSPVRGYVDLSDKLAYDPDTAVALLEGAGWTAGPDGIREKGGTALSLEAVYIYPSYQAEFELLQQQLVKIGVDLRPTYVESADLADRRARGDYDFLSWVNTRPDGDVLLTNYLSTQSDVFAKAPDATLDDLLLEQTQELDANARDALLARIQEHVLDHALSIPLHDTGTIVGLSPETHGVQFASKWIVLYDTWIEQS